MWLSLVIVLVICYLTVYRRKCFKGNTPPEYPGALPLIGHGLLFMGNEFGVVLKDIATTKFGVVLKDIATTSLAWGGVVSFRIGSTQQYMISDPDDCATIANACLEKNLIYDFIKPVLGEGLLTAKVPIWKSHRKLLAPAFNQSILDCFVSVFNSQGRKLIEELSQHSEGIPFDCLVHTDHNALETICLTAMGGINANELLSDKYIASRENAQAIVVKRYQSFWLHSDMIFNLSSLKKLFVEAIKVIQDGSNMVIQKKKEEVRNDSSVTSEKAGPKFKTFIDLIMEDYGQKGIMTDQEIREEVDTIIIAGHETTALTLLYTLILLGSHQEVQEQVYKEVSEVMGDRNVEKQDLSKLVYLEAVLKESLRLYPIAPYVIRQVTHDVKLKNYTLPVGSSACIAIDALHRHAVWGADADKFAPARWIDKTVPEVAAAYAPFSIGKRNCIGKTYAMMGLKIMLVHLVRSFRFTSDISKLKLKLEILSKPVSGHLISIEKRK